MLLKLPILLNQEQLIRRKNDRKEAITIENQGLQEVSSSRSEAKIEQSKSIASFINPINSTRKDRKLNVISQINEDSEEI